MSMVFLSWVISVLELIVLTVAQLCEYIKTTELYTLHELYGM